MLSALRLLAASAALAAAGAADGRRLLEHDGRTDCDEAAFMASLIAMAASPSCRAISAQAWEGAGSEAEMQAMCEGPTPCIALLQKVLEAKGGCDLEGMDYLDYMDRLDDIPEDGLSLYCSKNGDTWCLAETRKLEPCDLDQIRDELSLTPACEAALDAVDQGCLRTIIAELDKFDPLPQPIKDHAGYYSPPPPPSPSPPSPNSPSPSPPPSYPPSPPPPSPPTPLSPSPPPSPASPTSAPLSPPPSPAPPASPPPSSGAMAPGGWHGAVTAAAMAGAAALLL